MSYLDSKSPDESLRIHYENPVQFTHFKALMETCASLTTEELVRRCAGSGDVEAWEELVRRVHRLIALVIYRTAQRLGDSSRQTVDDLIQETYLKLCDQNCRLLRQFEHRHDSAFVGFVQIVAANITRDHFKAVRTGKRSKQRTAEIGDGFDPQSKEGSTGSASAIEKGVLINEVQSHLDACFAGPDQDRNQRIFWLYYRAGLSASAIAGLPEIGMTTKGVESLILRATKQLRERMAGSNQWITSNRSNNGEGILTAESL